MYVKHAIVNESFLQAYCETIDFPCGILRALIFITALITFTALAHAVWIFIVDKRAEKHDKDSTSKTETISTKSSSREISKSPAIAKKFSSNLEKIKKERIRTGWKITGISLGFLERIKAAPPFLGLNHDRPTISVEDEAELTEFFQASIYMEQYRDHIHGGEHRIVSGDNRQSIAEKVYGDGRYDYYVKERHVYPIGSILKLPYLNTQRPDHPNDVERKMLISRDLDKINSMLNRYNLTSDEAIPVLRMVYDAAQRTLEEESNQEEIVDPKKKDLAYQIGVDIQRFGDQFHSLKITASRESKRVKYEKASETLQSIYDELRPRANMVLKDTPIPQLITDLHLQFGLHHTKYEGLSFLYQDKDGYIRGKAAVPPEIVDRIENETTSLDETTRKIDSLISQLIELCKEMQ